MIIKVSTVILGKNLVLQVDLIVQEVYTFHFIFDLLIWFKCPDNSSSYGLNNRNYNDGDSNNGSLNIFYYNYFIFTICRES